MNAFDVSQNKTGAAAISDAGPKHFLELDRIPPATLRAMIDEARRRKQARGDLPKGATDAEAGLDAPLSGHMLAMVFEKPSTRTRVSF